MTGIGYLSLFTYKKNIYQIVQGDFLTVSRLTDSGTLTSTVIAWHICCRPGGVHYVWFPFWLSELSALFYLFYEHCGIYSGATQDGPPYTRLCHSLPSYLLSLPQSPISHSVSEAVFTV